MPQRLVHAALAVMLCLTVPFAYGQGRGKEPEKGGKSERKPEGKPGENPGGAAKPGLKSEKEQPAREGAKPEAKSGLGTEKKSPGGDWSERTHSGRQSNQPSGAEGAAAGRAVEKNKEPQASGAEGAAAGAAAAKRNSPPVSAAAGAAAVNRNSAPVSGAQGVAAGAAAENYRSNKVSTAEAATGYAAIRSSFNQPGMYGPQWYGTHTNAWAPTGWSANAAWTAANWNAIATQGGYGNVTPTSYNYGTNVTNVNGNVLVDSQDVGSAVQFSQQAADLAQRGIDADVSGSQDWLSLGVFALVRNESQQPQVILQLAVNGKGILRGNYTDEVAGHTFPILGAVDKQTQRVAWTVAGNTQSVIEAGLHNLTESEAPALIHRNGKTAHWILVRLEQPKAAE